MSLQDHFYYISPSSCGRELLRTTGTAIFPSERDYSRKGMIFLVGFNLFLGRTVFYSQKKWCRRSFLPSFPCSFFQFTIHLFSEKYCIFCYNKAGLVDKKSEIPCKIQLFTGKVLHLKPKDFTKTATFIVKR